MKVNNGIDPFLYRSLPQNLNQLKEKRLQGEPKEEFSKVMEKYKVTENISSDSISRIPSREAVLKEVAADPGKKKLYEASREFEAFFVEKVFREMKKNTGKSDFLDTGMAGEVFEDMLLTERVRAMNEQARFGLAEQMYTQLTASTASGNRPNAPS